MNRYEYKIDYLDTNKETYAITLDYLGLDGLDKKLFYFMHEHSIDSLTVNKGIKENVQYTITENNNG
tara:strand:+ start:328 stop:528 length:201 start_codon:yes stop_codon:yes gene_type:complete